MNGSNGLTKLPRYHAPLIYVTFFYVLLTSWTFVSVTLMGSKAKELPISTLLMIAFVIAYTWYFSLGIYYRVKVEDDGSIQFKSIRKTMQISFQKIECLEAPSITLRLGFMRFRLEHEKAYLFFVESKSLQQIFSFIRRVNPEIKIKGAIEKYQRRQDTLNNF